MIVKKIDHNSRFDKDFEKDVENWRVIYELSIFITSQFGLIITNFELNSKTYKVNRMKKYICLKINFFFEELFFHRRFDQLD